jgi:glycosyltransferase involved in cell wall biosynthesis
MEHSRRAVRGVALFVATFARPENVDAANWLLREIWPAVVAQIPEARLILAGAKSDTYLAGVPPANRGAVSATGYVASLSPYYREASVVVIPTRLGAGVKFKTLTAMLWGLPIVSTYQGVEGLASASLYAGVTDDPEEFARTVVEVLRDPATADEVARMGQRWAHDAAGAEQFTTSILASHGRAQP